MKITHSSKVQVERSRDKKSSIVHYKCLGNIDTDSETGVCVVVRSRVSATATVEELHTKFAKLTSAIERVIDREIINEGWLDIRSNP